MSCPTPRLKTAYHAPRLQTLFAAPRLRTAYHAPEYCTGGAQVTIPAGTYLALDDDILMLDGAWLALD